MGVRELPLAIATGRHAATTVASTAALARLVGIRVLATGGLGGVHRGASESFDESADLGTLARTPITVVCAGVKSILDVPATLERLETLGVTVVGYRTLRFPGFYVADSGNDLDWAVSDPVEVAAVMRAADRLGLVSGIVLANPVPLEHQLDPATHDAPAGGRSRRGRARGRPGQGGDALPPGPHVRGLRRRQPRSERLGRPEQRRPGGAGSRRLVRDRRVTPPQVIVVGDVINDVVVRPKGPVEVGTDTPSQIERSPGGSGANQAAWMAALNVEVRFAGRAGAADSADHREALERAGVETRLTDDEDLPTGTIVVLVSPDGERSMFTDRGADRALGAADLPAELLEGCRLLHVSAYPLFEPGSRDAVLQLCASAIAAGITVSIDPASAAGLRAVGRRAFLEWTSGAQLVFPNLDEGRLLTGLDDPDAIADALSARYPVVALKLGPAGRARGHLGRSPRRGRGAGGRGRRLDWGGGRFLRGLRFSVAVR